MKSSFPGTQIRENINNVSGIFYELITQLAFDGNERQTAKFVSRQ